jgi:tetracycline 7-halogenase / FADH2 O2-dependent halogenase
LTKARSTYDVAIVGSGFAGSLLATIVRRQGRSVILLEKGRHPRFAIGESSTPLSNLLLEDLARRYDLPGIAPLTKWGTWQRAYPNLECGLKRGFTFYHHQFGERAAQDPNREDQLLVAASPHDGIADTHWYRAGVDEHFVREAENIGVEYLDEVDLAEAVEGDGDVKLHGKRRGNEIDISARFVVDATGPRGFLHRAFGLPERPLPDFPQTQGLYTHFRGVGRLEHLPAWNSADAPYPIDDAALHHVFDGGWIWILRFRGGITSAGVAAVDSVAERFGFSEGAPAWDRLLQCLPTVRDQFASAVAERPFIYAPRLAFRSGAAAGKRWALLPSAAGFVDPLLSTGFPLVLLGVTRLAGIMEEHWDSAPFSAELAAYAKRTDEELLATARLIGGLYASMDNFPLFVSLSLLYFATASFAETARRLGKPHLASSFLLHDHSSLKTLVPALLQRARSVLCPDDSERLSEDILRAIEPFNIAGLGQRDRRNWYPVDAEDLLRGAPKLGANREEISRLLDRCGFHAGDDS